jgi:nucleoside phosphorylase
MKREVRNAACDVLVCFAVKEEACPFQRVAAKNPNVSVLVTGIGEINAEESVRGFLAKNSPHVVLTCGFAGALNPDLNLGQVIFWTEDEKLREQLLAGKARPAKFFCAERIAISVVEKAELRGSTDADAVEMESDVIQAICREKKIPCATVRAISDTAREYLPLDFNALMTADQKISILKLAGALLKSPGKVPQLLKLQQNTKMAAERLAKVLDGLLRAL